MAWKQGNHMEERKEKGTWIGDLLARIVFQTGTGLCALMLGILVPGFEAHAGEQGCQWGYQQEQKQEQHMQLSDEADNYLAVMLEDYDFTGLDEELAVYFPDLSIHADGIMKMLLDGKALGGSAVCKTGIFICVGAWYFLFLFYRICGSVCRCPSGKNSILSVVYDVSWNPGSGDDKDQYDYHPGLYLDSGFCEDVYSGVFHFGRSSQWHWNGSGVLSGDAACDLFCGSFCL